MNTDIPGKIFQIWCWRKMEKIIWFCGMRNEVVLYKSHGDRNILLTINRMNATCIDRILRMNCLVKHNFVGKIQFYEEEKNDLTRY